jgi:glycosyltransferase involved in cell wall biosynthesis
VLFLHTATAPPLGADTWVHAQIMAHLDPATHEIHAACVVGDAAEPTPTYQTLRAIPGVHLHPTNLGVESAPTSPGARVAKLLGIIPSAMRLIGLARYIRRNGIAFVHTSDRPRDAAATVLLGRLTKATSIVHSHVGYADWMSPLLKWALRNADVRIAISSFVARTLVDNGHPQESTYVVLNGIDPARWTPATGRAEARRALSVPDDAPLIVTICRLFSSKGPGDLIRALALVHQQHPTAQLLIAGREVQKGYAAELEQLIDKQDLRDHVRLLGHCPDVGPLLAAADVFAMPSIGEPFGLVYLEAMAMELPVVALESGGAPEVIVHGTTGLLSPPDDLERLAENLDTLLSDPDRRAQMARAGRRRVETHFTSTRMATDMAARYRQVQKWPTAAQEVAQGKESNDLAVSC